MLLALSKDNSVWKSFSTVSIGLAMHLSTIVHSFFSPSMDLVTRASGPDSSKEVVKVSYKWLYGPEAAMKSTTIFWYSDTKIPLSHGTGTGAE